MCTRILAKNIIDGKFNIIDCKKTQVSITRMSFCGVLGIVSYNDTLMKGFLPALEDNSKY